MNLDNECLELPEAQWIGGNFETFEFTVHDLQDPTVPVDLTVFREIRWILFYYGDSENPILNLTGHIVVSDHSKFNVYIKSEYTDDLNGLFQHQPVLIDNSRKEFRPAQGLINIIPRGMSENSQYIEKYDGPTLGGGVDI